MFAHRMAVVEFPDERFYTEIRPISDRFQAEALCGFGTGLRPLVAGGSKPRRRHIVVCSNHSSGISGRPFFGAREPFPPDRQPAPRHHKRYRPRDQRSNPDQT
jgi:hypothetical protein